MAKKRFFLLDGKGLEMYHILILIFVIATIFFFFTKGLAGSYTGIQNKGVSMKVYVSDKYGNPLYELGETKPNTYALVSYGGSYETTSYIMLTSVLSNNGATDVVFSAAHGTNPCAPGNSNPLCINLPNLYGGTGSSYNTCTIDSNCPSGEVCSSRFGCIDADDGMGSINGVYAHHFGSMPNGELLLMPGASDIEIYSEPILVDNLTAGNIEFTLGVDAEYLDERGIRQPLTGIFGSIVLNVQREQCSDGTVINTCSVTQRGKRCEFQADNLLLVDRATICGCCLPGEQGCTWVPNGEICSTPDCVNFMGRCIPGTMTFCEINGTSTENCGVCGYTYCPINYYFDEAIGCIGTLCDYPDRVTNVSVNLGYGGGTGIPINFRTTNLNYNSGGIGYSSTCGNELAPYGFNNRVTNVHGSCTTTAPLGTYIMDVPGGWLTGGNPARLFQATDPRFIYICDDLGGTRFEYSSYDNLDPDRMLVNTTPFRNVPERELVCGS